MKKIFFIIATTFIVISAKSTEPNTEYASSLPKASSYITGWYFQVQMNSTSIKDKSAYANSLAAGFQLGSNMNIGLKGAYFTDYNDLFFSNVSKGNGAYLKGAYIGLSIDPSVPLKGSLSLAFPVLFAYGNTTFSSQKGFFSGSSKSRIDSESYLMIEPGAELQWHLLRNIKLCFGLSYRHTSGMSIGDLPYDMLDGLNTAVSLRILN